MALLLKPASEPAEAWIAQFRRLMPELELRVWPEVGDPDEVEYLLVAPLPAGALAQFRHLKLIASLPAGVDHLLRDPGLPAGVPVTRCVNTDGDGMMTEFVVMNVLRHHRRLPEYHALQAAAEWRKLPQPTARERRVGIMGMGSFGAPIATRLRGFEFEVAGWTRRPRRLAGVACYTGADGLPAFLARTDILVCLLPLTAETRGLIDARALALLPAGAQLINCGRGELVVEADLLAALESGHIAAASLDVFESEPLPPASPLWRHPRVTVTPHVASVTRAASAARIMAENIRRLAEGETLLNLVDRDAGY